MLESIYGLIRISSRSHRITWAEVCERFTVYIFAHIILNSLAICTCQRLILQTHIVRWSRAKPATAQCAPMLCRMCGELIQRVSFDGGLSGFWMLHNNVEVFEFALSVVVDCVQCLVCVVADDMILYFSFAQFDEVWIKFDELYLV